MAELRRWPRRINVNWHETMNVSDGNLGWNESGISWRTKKSGCFCCMRHCRDQLTHVITRAPRSKRTYRVRERNRAVLHLNVSTVRWKGNRDRMKWKFDTSISSDYRLRVGEPSNLLPYLTDSAFVSFWMAEFQVELQLFVTWRTSDKSDFANLMLRKGFYTH